MSHPKARKQFSPQGIGRGHASLPPKPFVPGKPLPRDTEAIVLTSGGDGPHFSTISPKPKRSYSTVASETQMRPMDPAVTNLTPQNHLTPQTRANASGNFNHSPVVPKTITPPAEQTMPAKTSGYNQSHAEHQGNGHAAVMPANTKPFRPNGTSENVVQGVPEQHAYNHGMRHDSQHRPEFNRPDFRNHHQEFHNGYPPNGGFAHDMYPPLAPMNGMSGMHHAPHPAHLQGQMHMGPPFFHTYPGTLTPPNSGSMFLPPPLPMVDTFSDRLNGTNPSAFAPHMLPVPAEFGHPQAFSPPPVPHNGSGQFQAPPETTKKSEGTPTLKPGVPVGTENSIAARNPKLQGISFIVDDEEPASYNGTSPTSTARTSENTQTHSQKDGSDETSTPKDIASPTSDIFPIPQFPTSYMASRFLSEKLADVRLVLHAKGTEKDPGVTFPAHSFVLGQSPKLCKLIEDAWGTDQVPLKRATSSSSWAEEMEDDAQLGEGIGLETVQSNTESLHSSYSSANRLTTITFTTHSKYVTQESFLLALKSMYLGHQLELDAYLDPTHPNHDKVSQLRREISDFGSPASSVTLSVGSQPSLGLDDGKSQEIRMLERSIELLTAGCLLGLDGVVQKAVDGIRSWGMRFEGKALERLFKFLLQDTVDMQKDSALSNIIQGSEGIKQGLIQSITPDAIDFFARNLPATFRPDFRAPSSKYLSRLSIIASPPETGSSTPQTAMSSKAQDARMLRTAYSTLFFSLPFEVLKEVLEHPDLVVRGKKQRFDLSCGVMQERERRRKRESKAIQEKVGLAPGDQLDGVFHQMGGTGIDGVTDDQLELLFWEESVVTTFGHGDVGVELVKRRKGAPGGRMLWKIGRTIAK